jgi:hypothetical protein
MSCSEQRDLVVAYVRGELARGLERQRLEAHLGHCDECSGVKDTIAAGLATARSYSPEVSPEHLDRLASRLSPYTEGSTRSLGRVRLFAQVALASSLLALVGVVVMALSGSSAPVAIASATAVPVYSEPTPFVRLASLGTWDGEVGATGSHTDILLRRGLLGFSFVGGEGRALVVRTGLAEVHVIGTRFFVDAGEELRIGVGEGRIGIVTASGVRFVSDGEAVSVSTSGAMVPVPVSDAERRVLDDASLREHHASIWPSLPLPSFGGNRRPRLERPASGVARPEPVAETVTSDTVLLERLAEAEALAQRGEIDVALAIYRECAAAAGSKRPYYRDVSHYEAARLIGFVRQDRQRARAAFNLLAERGEGEVRRQAVLAICELDRQADPCGATRCLDRVQRDSRQGAELRSEARILKTRWGLPADCPPAGE